jgi:hypothetical protein
MATRENKTKETGASVKAYLDAIGDKARRADCRALATLVSRATGEPPKMWGATIVGFGSYHYKYESGREGDSCLVGFSARKGDLSLYLADYPGREKLLARLGAHTSGKACIYVKRLADLDAAVLEKLVAAAAAARRMAHAR